MKFKVLGGAYTEDDKTYPGGSIATSKYELEKIFGSAKFQKVSAIEAKELEKKKAEDEKLPAPIVEPETDVVPEVEEESLGDDVSDLFDGATEENGIKVFMNGKKYFVQDVEDDNKIINKDGIGVTKNKAQKLIDELVKGV